MLPEKNSPNITSTHSLKVVNFHSELDHLKCKYSNIWQDREQDKKDDQNNKTAFV